MPTYTIETPLGKRLKIESDSEQEALQLADQWADDTDAVVRTVYGEARGDPDSQAGVASVILNRAGLTGRAPREVVTEKGQFEPWGDDSARARMEALDPRSPEYQDILGRVFPALNGEDRTGGATHFYAPKAQAQLGREAPTWDDGSGVDMGAHRFFKRPGDFGAPPQATGEVGDAVIEPAAAQGASQGDGRFFDAKTGESLSPAQTETYAGLLKGGKFDLNARPGSEGLPLAQRAEGELPAPGLWYVDLAGRLHQVPGGPEHTSPLATAADLATDLVGAHQPIAEIALRAMGVKKDPRAEAIESGLASGLLMGGKNEAGAFVDAVPTFFGGGIDPAHKRFAESLKARDDRDAMLEANFPNAMNAGRVVGAATGAVMLPEMGATSLAKVGIQSGLGGVGGFLSTDGSTEDRLKGAAIGAGLGGALAGVAPVVTGRLRNAALSAAKGLEANSALTEMGTSFADLSPEARAAIQGLIQQGRSPADAARLVLGADLPVPIPMTRGDMTGLPTHQLDFNLARRGARGERAAQIAQDFGADQQAAIRGNVDAIGSEMAGGPPPGFGEGGTGVADALSSAERASKRGVNAAYDAARAAPPVRVPDYDMERLVGSTLQDLQASYAIEDIPSTARHVYALVDQMGEGGLDVRRIYETRQRLSALRAAGGVESAAAGQAVRQIDDFMSDAVSAGLLHGDPAAVGAWRAAIGARREHARIFQDGDLVARLTERQGFGEGARLKVDPGDAANLIFGRSALGMAGRSGLYRDLNKIRDLVPEADWNRLRAEHFARLAQAGEGGVENGAQQFSGVKFLKAWNDAKARDMRLIETLYTPREIATVNKFAAASARVMSPVRGGDNASNTSVALRALKHASGRLAKALPWVGDTLVKQVDEMLGVRATQAATRPQPRIVAPAPRGGIGIVGGELGGSASSRPDRDAPVAVKLR